MLIDRMYVSTEDEIMCDKSVKKRGGRSNREREKRETEEKKIERKARYTKRCS